MGGGKGLETETLYIMTLIVYDFKFRRRGYLVGYKTHK